MAPVYYKWLSTAILALMHPFFVGVTEIQHNSKDHTLEISVKLFADDFEKALAKINNVPVDLTQPKDSVRTNQFVASYLQKHLLLKLNGKPVQMVFIGFEKEREAAWCFLQVNNVPSVQKIEIDNTLLYDAFDQQINLMHVIVNGERKSTKLAYPDQHTEFVF
ncbi:DUF6702 family protein [Flavihumibacter profundi]|uniref:DUF6702 family protein n=1 Tax=Flavihumibacter profundi TaxID=2716883 RepID=UPI001CC40275|nr:DUF6702 family protein [Flavihumibacter profundi]MBZ5856544.1 hypothetical protein [Flavihumibacter profundi]